MMDSEELNSNVRPAVSIVTGVYNAAKHLAKSAESILSQDGISWEWVVVDDGSTDGSLNLLRQFAKEDARVRVLQQDHGGLTRALIRGCDEARGTTIARHDADDVSLPGRFQAQHAFLDSHPEVAIVSSWIRLVGPAGEELMDCCPTENTEAMTASLRTDDPKVLVGPPHHGSVAFRKSDYTKVGGYRSQFYFAQDLDLWSRLIEIGSLAILPTVYYHATFDEGCVSAQHRPQQIALSRLILAAAGSRRRGEDESVYLEKAKQIHPSPHKSKRPSNGAAANYWIGRMLQSRRDRRAREYFRKAIEQDPFLWRARVALTLNLLGIVR